jgi:hypothetical protein
LAHQVGLLGFKVCEDIGETVVSEARTIKGINRDLRMEYSCSWIGVLAGKQAGPSWRQTIYHSRQSCKRGRNYAQGVAQTQQLYFTKSEPELPRQFLVGRNLVQSQLPGS